MSGSSAGGTVVVYESGGGGGGGIIEQEDYVVDTYTREVAGPGFGTSEISGVTYEQTGSTYKSHQSVTSGRAYSEYQGSDGPYYAMHAPTHMTTPFEFIETNCGDIETDMGHTDGSEVNYYYPGFYYTADPWDSSLYCAWVNYNSPPGVVRWNSKWGNTAMPNHYLYTEPYTRYWLSLGFGADIFTFDLLRYRCIVEDGLVALKVWHDTRDGVPIENAEPKAWLMINEPYLRENQVQNYTDDPYFDCTMSGVEWISFNHSVTFDIIWDDRGFRPYTRDWDCEVWPFTTWDAPFPDNYYGWGARWAWTNLHTEDPEWSYLDGDGSSDHESGEVWGSALLVSNSDAEIANRPWKKTWRSSKGFLFQSDFVLEDGGKITFGIGTADTGAFVEVDTDEETVTAYGKVNGTVVNQQVWDGSPYIVYGWDFKQRLIWEHDVEAGTDKVWFWAPWGDLRNDGDDAELTEVNKLCITRTIDSGEAAGCTTGDIRLEMQMPYGYCGMDRIVVEPLGPGGGGEPPVVITGT